MESYHLCLAAEPAGLDEQLEFGAAGMLVAVFSARRPFMEPLTERTASSDRWPKVRLLKPHEGEGWPTVDLSVTFSPLEQAKQQRFLPVEVTGLEDILLGADENIETDSWQFCVHTQWIFENNSVADEDAFGGMAGKARRNRDMRKSREKKHYKASLQHGKETRLSFKPLLPQGLPEGEVSLDVAAP